MEVVPVVSMIAMKALLTTKLRMLLYKRIARVPRAAGAPTKASPQKDGEPDHQRKIINPAKRNVLS